MSENAERPARSGRGSGQKERPTASSVRFRPRIGREGALLRMRTANMPGADAHFHTFTTLQRARESV